MATETATAVKTIDVPLPEGVSVPIEDMEALRSLFGAITALRFEKARRWPRIRRALERDGWEVCWGLQWHVEARRGRDLEQACGRTLDEVFTSVWQVAGTGEPLEGTP